MFKTTRALVAATLGFGLWLAPTAAVAQGFFQQLFGMGSPPAMEAPQSRPGQFLTPGGRPYQMPYSHAPRQRSDDDDDRETKGGKYKTICVRMCDGYFFPISNSTSRRGFFRDQTRCRAACGDDARLFHVPAGSTEVSSASDGHGRIYGMLSVAYRHKKGVVPGCQCRPEPWSAYEMGRHAQYAQAEAEKLAAERAAQHKIASADQTIGEKAAAAESEEKVDSAPTRDAKPAAPVTIKAAARLTTKPATQRQPPAPRLAQPATPQPAPTVSAGFGGGGGYSWPGDAPRR